MKPTFQKWLLRSLLGLLFLAAAAYGRDNVGRVYSLEQSRLEHAEEFGKMQSDVTHIRQQVDKLVDKLEEQ